MRFNKFMIAITQQMFVVIFQAVNCWQTVFYQWSLEYLPLIVYMCKLIYFDCVHRWLFFSCLNMFVCMTRFPCWLIQVSLSVKIWLTSFVIVILLTWRSLAEAFTKVNSKANRFEYSLVLEVRVLGFFVCSALQLCERSLPMKSGLYFSFKKYITFFLTKGCLHHFRWLVEVNCWLLLFGLSLFRIRLSIHLKQECGNHALNTEVRMGQMHAPNAT